jgi:hypothetical protein
MNQGMNFRKLLSDLIEARAYELFIRHVDGKSPSFRIFRKRYASGFLIVKNDRDDRCTLIGKSLHDAAAEAAARSRDHDDLIAQTGHMVLVGVL